MAPSPCPHCASTSTERSESTEPALRWAAYGVAFLLAWWTITDLTYRREGALVMAALFLWPVARAWRRSSEWERRPVASSSFTCLACGHQWRHQPSPVAKVLSVVTTALLMLWSGFVAVVGWAPRAVGRGLRGVVRAAVAPPLGVDCRGSRGVAGTQPEYDDDPSPAGSSGDGGRYDPTYDDIVRWSYVAQQNDSAKGSDSGSGSSGGYGGRLDAPKPGAATNLGEYKPGRWGNLG